MITSDQIVVLTSAQLAEYARLVARSIMAEFSGQPKADEALLQHRAPERIKGIQAIANHFDVSIPTAKLWRATWLKPAITKVGQMVYMDVERGEELFEQHRYDVCPEGCA